ncbi:hypothetical protein E9993_16515 [Labilibacter sediminis]|nr:hypothetical protein E9993_16515 [Labilibacter sediminis]
MKNLLIIVCLGISTLVFSQEQTKRVYGPKAKNERVWINKANTSTVVTNDNERVTGGEAKNNKTWAKNYNKSETTAVTTNEEKKSVKGPNAKNYVVYKRNNNTDIKEGQDQ